MNDLQKKFEYETQNTKLTAEEKRLMWAHISTKIGMKSIPSPYQFSFVYKAVSVFLIVLLVSSGTAFAGEYALPGDALYPLKVNITEPLRESFAVTPEARVLWNTKMVVRRIEEIEKLAARMELTDDAKIEVEKHLEKRKEKAEAIALEMEMSSPSDAERIAAEFYSSLSAHSQILDRLSDSSEDEGTRRISRAIAKDIRGGKFMFFKDNGRGADVIAVRLAKESAPGESPETLTMAMMANEVQTEDTSEHMSDEQKDQIEKLKERNKNVLKDARKRFTELRTRWNATTSSRVGEALKGLEDSLENDGNSERFTEVLEESTRLNTFLEATDHLNHNDLIEPYFEEDHGDNDSDDSDNDNSGSGSDEEEDDTSGHDDEDEDNSGSSGRD